MSDTPERTQKPWFGCLDKFIKVDNDFCLNDKKTESWEYDFKFEYKNQGNKHIYFNLDDEKDSINRFLKYKNNKKIGSQFDCDGSGDERYTCTLSREMYNTLWAWEAKKTRYGKSIFGDNIDMSPDTMNSFMYTYNKMYTKKEKLKEFAELTHTLGNFVLVPRNVAVFNYKNKNFNQTRGMASKGIHDFWDLSLNVLKEKWNESFEKYINVFFLWDYVSYDNQLYNIKPLMKPHRDLSGKIVNKHGKCDNNDYNEFITNVCLFIKRRGIFMVAMLKIASLNSGEFEGNHQEEWQDWNVSGIYEKIMEEVYLTGDAYDGYDAVFKKIEKIAEDYQNEDVKFKVKEILNSAKTEIDKVKLN